LINAGDELLEVVKTEIDSFHLRIKTTDAATRTSREKIKRRGFYEKSSFDFHDSAAGPFYLELVGGNNPGGEAFARP
jgi:hypothetical protein